MRASIATFLSAMALAAASPALPPRSCSTAYPTAVQSINSGSPDQDYANQAPGVLGPMPINTSNGGLQYFNDQLLLTHAQIPAFETARINSQFIDFTIPAGAYGCQLKIIDNADELYYETNGKNDGRVPAINFTSLIPNAINLQNTNATWNTIMNNPSIIASSNWGTASLAANGDQAINGAACPRPTADGEDGHLQYVIGFADQIGPGYSMWVLPQTTPGVNGGLSTNGVYMTYNC